jgi:hypothetical protein
MQRRGVRNVEVSRFRYRGLDTLEVVVKGLTERSIVKGAHVPTSWKIRGSQVPKLREIIHEADLFKKKSSRRVRTRGSSSIKNFQAWKRQNTLSLTTGTDDPMQGQFQSASSSRSHMRNP